jgi:hypothetical protein
MRKISLSVLGLYLGILSAISQATPDSSAYKNKKLKLDEIDFVSGYYHQNGNNSAVTGGIGTEKLTDVANTIELKFSKYDRQLRKNNLSFELGIDHYSSASSDKIDPTTISSASSADTRFYPSLSWTRQNEEKRTTIGLSTSFSGEYDYTSLGFGASFVKASKDNNREFSAKVQAYLDKWKVIYPIELSDNGGIGIEPDRHPPRNSFSTSLSLAQVINRNMQVSVIVEPTYQTGMLATKYQRVYFSEGKMGAETLPDNRLKIPIGLRANYFAGDRFIVRSFYRFYVDDWGVKAHTIDLEAPIKISPFFSVSPFYRFYTQTAADYFAPFGQHSIAENYFTSDYDLSKFNSHFVGAGIRVVPPNGVFGIQRLNSAEIRYGHYNRSNGLQSDIISLNLKFK